MTDPGTELVQRAEWERDRRAALLAQRCAAAEAADAAAERAAAAAAADAADAAQFAAFRRQLSGEPQLSVSAILERSRLAEDGPVRDPAAPWGSPQNPALLIGDRWIDPVPQQASRSADELLGRARELSGALARYRRPRRGGTRAITRSGTAVRSEDCVWCTQEGVSDEESYLLHSDPDLACPVTPPGSRFADDSPHEQRSSGLGWPQQTPMIYR